MTDASKKWLEGVCLHVVEDLARDGANVEFVWAYIDAVEVWPNEFWAGNIMGQIDQITKTLQRLRRKGYVTSVKRGVYGRANVLQRRTS
jgi:hypothetical protein